MKVSVIVPTYNRADLVRATLRSIAGQSYRTIEAIVVDDGSTDDTEAVVVEEAAAAALPIRYLKKENGGCSSARNAGIDAATGDCLAFLDSDDQFTPEAIASMVGGMLSSGADFVYSPCFEVSPSGSESLHLPAAAGDPGNFAREHFRTLSARSCSILYRRGIFDRLRFRETERYNEDSDFLQRVALTFRGAYCPVPTARVFQHGGNKSANKKEINLAVLRSCESILGDFPSFASELGAAGEQRLEELRRRVAESLTVAGEFVAAEEMLRRLTRAPLSLSLAVALKSAAPVETAVFARAVVTALRRFIPLGGVR